MPSSVPRRRERLAAWLPHGAALADDDWRWRHAAVSLVLAAHLPALLVAALVAGRPGDLWHAVPLVLLLAAGRTRRLGRALRSLCVAVGLLTCSGVVVHLAGNTAEAHFHFFVVVAVIALYQDWAVYALAIGFVLLHHGVVAWQSPSDGTGTLRWTVLHALAVVALSAVLMLFWRAHEVSRAAAERARAELTDGQDSVRARLADAEQLRGDLIGTVSHEFRTPLTGIRLAALTLLRRGDRLTPERSREVLTAILEQQERLSRLLENMLVAAEAIRPDETASSAVEQVAAQVAAVRRRGTAVSVVVEPGLHAHIDRTSLTKVLENLVDNALQHGARGAEPLVAGGRDDDGVWLTVSNEGRTLDLTRKDVLFAPFTQAESGVTRSQEGLGVGLHVVKRLVEAYGGTVDVDSHSGWVSVEVRLRPGAGPAPAPTEPPASLPVPSV